MDVDLNQLLKRLICSTALPFKSIKCVFVVDKAAAQGLQLAADTSQGAKAPWRQHPIQELT